ncbi:TOM complex subunit Tom22 [Schizosaccharomyces cryophilus OY26]|uniref:TOM complex subunit Tom22 n=1 Tax=Schizosaccharomyces cryophilus (strain OY26 / ATCC MYA-4695 / CBS 11777 / NBRC 106824 / NRRL Y48691) TaxID=653667 RepID=S9XCY2_SCHCR|nr:TOM complex subunit Tom22 [Schizosaccharomyces cryophilus OY26]EPY51701.1 TOM complex subunit Tom22 [Schizosaccharomyces cryophilus OY26]
MVKLEEVVDETELQTQGQNVAEKDKYIYAEEDVEESDSDESDFEGLEDETIFDRIAALKEVVPVTWRVRIADSAKCAVSGVSRLSSFGGKSLWVLSTSALLLGVPFMMSVEDEAQLSEYEKQLKDQRGANEVIAPGATSNALPQ